MLESQARAEARAEAAIARLDEHQLTIAQNLIKITDSLTAMATRQEAHEGRTQRWREQEESWREQEERWQREAEVRRAEYDLIHKEVDERLQVLVAMMDEWIRERRSGDNGAN